MPAKLQSVADCYDQTSLVEFERSEDPAMVNAVEKPSASKTTGSLGEMQRTEAWIAFRAGTLLREEQWSCEEGQSS